MRTAEGDKWLLLIIELRTCMTIGQILSHFFAHCQDLLIDQAMLELSMRVVCGNESESFFFESGEGNHYT